MHDRVLIGLLNHRVLSLLTACLLGAGLLGGCTTPRANLTIESAGRTALIRPDIVTAVYDYTDFNTLNVYLSDIPQETLINGDRDITGLSGHLIHIHMFILPKAGETPIQETACNITTRHAVMADNAFGLYGGGGFALPSRWNAPGDDAFSAKILDASLRLIRAGPAFTDPLGSARLSGTLTARLDPPLARIMASRLDGFLERLDEAEPPPQD